MVRRSLAKTIFFTGLMLLSSGLLVSCAPDTAAPRLQPNARPTNTQAPAAAPETGLQPIKYVLPPFTDNACLECHTNQDKLIELAAPRMVAESLSEGPG